MLLGKIEGGQKYPTHGTVQMVFQIKFFNDFVAPHDGGSREVWGGPTKTDMDKTS